MHEQQLPLSRAITYIFLSTVVISGMAVLSLLFYQYVCHERMEDERFLIRKLAISCEGPSLSSDYLAEYLGLSEDAPTNLYALSLRECRAWLERSPYICSAALQRQRPDTLVLKLKTRQPFALLADFAGVAIDEEGVPFPTDLLSERGAVPYIRLGIESLAWQEAVEGRRFWEARRLLTEADKFFQLLDVELLGVDMSFLEAEQYGLREIILLVEIPGRFSPLCWVRLPPRHWEHQLRNLQALLSQKAVDAEVIDLRMENMALLSSGSFGRR